LPTPASYGAAASNQGSKISFKASCEASKRGAGFFETWLVDPLNIQSFQLDVQFDPTVLQFVSITYISPYVQTTAPDLSQVSSGLIRDIAGTSSTFPPPSGDGNIFSVNFLDLKPTVTTTLTVLASGSEVQTVFNTDTAGLVTVPAADCIPCSMVLEGVPEPSSLIMAGTAAVFGLIGAAVRRRNAA